MTLREHRRRVPEDRHHLAAKPPLGPVRRRGDQEPRDVQPRRHDRRDRDAARTRRHRCRAHQRSATRRDRRRALLTGAIRARAAARDASRGSTRPAPRDQVDRHVLSGAALLHRRGRRRDQRPRQPGAAAGDRRRGDGRRARGWPSPASSRSARSCGGGSIWCRPRRCAIWSTRSRRCRRAPRSISSKAR